MRRPVIVAIGAVCLVAAGLGLAAGLRFAGLDESSVINRVARDWVASGGQETDCVARPGTGRVWLVVTCGTGEAAMVRAFDRWGYATDASAQPGI